jgi:hypothetical protein
MGITKMSNIQIKFDANTMYLLSIDPVRDGYSPEKAEALFEKLPERLKLNLRCWHSAPPTSAIVNVRSCGWVTVWEPNCIPTNGSRRIRWANSRSCPPQPLLQVYGSIGGVAAEVQYAGAAQGLIAGVIQVNILIPAGAPSGEAVPITLTIGQRESGTGVTLAIK